MNYREKAKELNKLRFELFSMGRGKKQIDFLNWKIAHGFTRPEMIYIGNYEHLMYWGDKIYIQSPKYFLVDNYEP
jgi:hypothetical protein